MKHPSKSLEVFEKLLSTVREHGFLELELDAIEAKRFRDRYYAYVRRLKAMGQQPLPTEEIECKLIPSGISFRLKSDPIDNAVKEQLEEPVTN